VNTKKEKQKKKQCFLNNLDRKKIGLPSILKNMNFYKVWKVWAMLNFSFWVGFESGSPRVKKGFVAGIPYFGRGCIKGISASIFPPVGIWYAYHVYLNWETSRDLD